MAKPKTLDKRINLHPLQASLAAHNDFHRGSEDFVTCTQTGCSELRESTRRVYLAYLSDGNEDKLLSELQRIRVSASLDPTNIKTLVEPDTEEEN